LVSRALLLARRLTVLFATQTRQHSGSLLEGSDACFAPALTPVEATTHPHTAARAVYAKRAGVL
jgi:crotonobetainyl-CoA:carnitine CoA-transferase CaiB-like acyl-CoA transferase